MADKKYKILFTNGTTHCLGFCGETEAIQTAKLRSLEYNDLNLKLVEVGTGAEINWRSEKLRQ